MPREKRMLSKLLYTYYYYCFVYDTGDTKMPKKKTKFCIDCELEIPIDLFSLKGFKGDKFKDGWRCYDCSDKKRGMEE